MCNQQVWLHIIVNPCEGFIRRRPSLPMSNANGTETERALEREIVSTPAGRTDQRQPVMTRPSCGQTDRPGVGGVLPLATPASGSASTTNTGLRDLPRTFALAWATGGVVILRVRIWQSGQHCGVDHRVRREIKRRRVVEPMIGYTKWLNAKLLLTQGQPG